MPDIKISQLPNTTILGATDLFAISKDLGSGNWESNSIAADKVLGALDSTRLLKVAQDGIRDASTIGEGVALAIALVPTESQPVSIQVLPGAYYEDNPINLPKWITIYSEGGQYSVAIVANHDGNIFVGNGNSQLDGFTIIGNPSFSNVAYVSASTDKSIFKNMIIIDCQMGVFSNGGNIDVDWVDAYSINKAFGRFFAVIAGGYMHAQHCDIQGISMQPVYGFYSSDANSEIRMYNCSAINCVNGIFVNNNGYLDCFSGHFEDCVNAVHIGSIGVNEVKCVSTMIEDSTSKDLLIESSSAILSFVGAFDSSKFSIVNGATISSSANDKNSSGMLSLGQSTSWGTMNIGTAGAITLGKDVNLNIGEGASFVNDQYGNPIVEFWSYNDSNPSGSKFARFVNNAGTQLTSANDAIIVGCKYQFPSIKLDVMPTTIFI